MSTTDSLTPLREGPLSRTDRAGVVQGDHPPTDDERRAMRRAAHVIAARRPDAITGTSPEDRAASLKRIAELVAHDDPGISPVIDLIVPVLAADMPTTEVTTRFEALVEALIEFQAFVNDEAGYLDRHGWTLSDQSGERMFTRLEGDIDWCLRRLLDPETPA